MSTSDHEVHAVPHASAADRWIVSRLHKMIADVRTHINEYRLDLASQRLYEFIWNEYCDWYLELSKPVIQNGTARRTERHPLYLVTRFGDQPARAAPVHAFYYRRNLATAQGAAEYRR